MMDSEIRNRKAIQAVMSDGEVKEFKTIKKACEALGVKRYEIRRSRESGVKVNGILFKLL